MTSYIHTFKVVCLITMEEYGIQCLTTNYKEAPLDFMDYIIQEYPGRFTSDPFIAENLGYSYEGYNEMRQQEP